MSDLISRADAIDAVRNVARDLIQDRCMPLGCATDFTDALSALPSANVIEFDFNKYQPRVRNKVNDGTPSADAVQGEWIEKYNGNGWNDFWDYTCSNCGKKYERADAVLYHANYCPNCGARMKGGAE